jgi:hypothetical protein
MNLLSCRRSEQTLDTHAHANYISGTACVASPLGCRCIWLATFCKIPRGGRRIGGHGRVSNLDLGFHATSLLASWSSVKFKSSEARGPRLAHGDFPHRCSPITL